MEIIKQQITIADSCNLIGKSKDTFSPLKEAITNSLDAISQRQKFDESFAADVIVNVHFKTTINILKEEKTVLDFISVEDNGIGFTSENLENFKNFGSKSKGLNNRGTGKIQIFWQFNEISIDSIFCENFKWHKLTAHLKQTGEYEEN